MLKRVFKRHMPRPITFRHLSLVALALAILATGLVGAQSALAHAQTNQLGNSTHSTFRRVESTPASTTAGYGTGSQKVTAQIKVASDGETTTLTILETDLSGK